MVQAFEEEGGLVPGTEMHIGEDCDLSRFASNYVREYVALECTVMFSVLARSKQAS